MSEEASSILHLVPFFLGLLFLYSLAKLGKFQKEIKLFEIQGNTSLKVTSKEIFWLTAVYFFAAGLVYFVLLPIVFVYIFPASDKSGLIASWIFGSPTVLLFLLSLIFYVSSKKRKTREVKIS